MAPRRAVLNCLLVRGRIYCFFCAFLILPGCRSRSSRVCEVNNYCGIPISRTLIFSNLPITRTKSRSLSSVEHCNFTPDFSKYPIFRTDFRFPWRFEKSGLRRNFGMIIVSLNSRIVNVFVFSRNLTAFNSHAFGHCVIFQARSSPPAQVRRCPYPYAFIFMTKFVSRRTFFPP